MIFYMGFCFFSMLGIGVYPIFGSGWSSNSKYSLLGGIRSIAQTISYEVVFSLIIFCYIIFVNSYDFYFYYYFHFIFFMYFPVFFCWLICLLSELNRTPFDFAEGERELVSGFNIEYGGYGFAIIFISEYGFIIFLSLISSFLYFGLGILSLFYGFIFMFFILLVRGRYPRYRYDKLIYLAWKGILPVILNYLIYCLGVFIFIIYLFYLNGVLAY